MFSIREQELKLHYKQDHLRMNVAADQTIIVGKVSRKKVAVLLDFVQMRGGRAMPKFVHFSQTVCIRSIWGWGGRGRPLPKFFGTLALKKVVK